MDGGGGGGVEVAVAAVVEAVVEAAGVELRAVHFARWCRRNQPHKYFPPLKRTKIKPTNTSWIRFLRSHYHRLVSTRHRHRPYRTG